jgi:zinc protease
MNKTLSRSLLAVGMAFALGSPAAMASDADDGVIDIPFTRYTLDNGLTLIVHEDHKAPVVAVNIWYDVGSANEPEGRSGFAHLFEHLMFNGSENWEGEYFEALEQLGATGINGTTNFDRTNYFQVVPTSALDAALWLESDRMGHLLGVVDQARLDEQRGVVQNEKRQGENQPYGQVFNTIIENTYPDGHPYDHTVIGSMDDLNAAELDDVHEWFRTYYGPNNAVLVVAGDVDPEQVRARVDHYFGDIDPGPPLVQPQLDVARRDQESRWTMEDRVPQPRLYMIWNGPAFGDDDLEYLTIAADVMATGKSSRLYKRLVYEDQIATDVTTFAFPRQLGGLLGIIVTANPGGDLAAVESAVREELERFLDGGPTREEVERSQTGQRAGFLRGLENVGGFGGKSDVLASYEVYFGDAGAYREVQERIQSADRRDVHAAAREWFDSGVFVLEVHPFADARANADGADRSTGLPVPEEFPNGEFPEYEIATLSNGLRVMLSQRDHVPLVNMSLQLDAGYSSDQFATPGTAALAMGMLDEGTTSRDALEISDELADLGATLGAGSNIDRSSVTMSALRDRMSESLDLFADVILNPSFPENEFTRLQQLQLAQIQREMSQPVSMALRVFPRLLYGQDHAYSNPYTGSGFMESVSAMTVDDMRNFHSTWFKPNNATLIVVGNVAMDELVPMLEGAFGGWMSGDVPSKNIAEVGLGDEAVVYLVDRPGSQQSIIFAGHLAPPKSDPQDLTIEAANSVLSGFTGRLNMNLREDKSWAYGAGSFILDTAGERIYLAYAPVQSDRTADSMAEIQMELEGIRSGGGRPVTDEELQRTIDRNTLTLPGRWQTNGAVMGDLIEMDRFDLAPDYWDTYAERSLALTREAVAEQADRLIHTDRLVWVVVGDRAMIEEGIRELDLGEIRFLDADGNPVD